MFETKKTIGLRAEIELLQDQLSFANSMKQQYRIMAEHLCTKNQELKIEKERLQRQLDRKYCECACCKFRKANWDLRDTVKSQEGVIDELRSMNQKQYDTIAILQDEYDNAHAEVHNLHREIKELRMKNIGLKEEVEALRKRDDERTIGVREYITRIGEKNEEIEEQKNQIEHLQSLNKGLCDRIYELRMEIEDHEKPMTLGGFEKEMKKIAAKYELNLSKHKDVKTRKYEFTNPRADLYFDNSPLHPANCTITVYVDKFKGVRSILAKIEEDVVDDCL